MIKDKLEKLNEEMSHRSEKIWNDGKKSAIRNSIAGFIDANPILGFDNKNYTERENRFDFSFIFLNRMKLASAFTVVALTLGVSVTYASQGALPGDSLYGIKTNVNEGVRSLLAVSPKQKAEFHVVLAEERIKETEKLAARGKIKPETAIKLNEDFKKEVVAADEKIKELSEGNKHQDALEVSSKLESSLKAHESILDDLEGDDDKVNDFVASVGSHIDMAEDIRSEAESKLKEGEFSKEATSVKMRMTKDVVNKTSSLLEVMEEKLTLESINEARRRLKRAERSYENGREKYLRKSYGDAFILFEKANRQAEETNTYLNTKAEIESATGNENTNTPVPEVTPSVPATTTPSQNEASVTDEIIGSSTPKIEEGSTSPNVIEESGKE